MFGNAVALCGLYAALTFSKALEFAFLSENPFQDRISERLQE
jgi:hypothetical protein